jgi:hypothetical protein
MKRCLWFDSLTGIMILSATALPECNQRSHRDGVSDGYLHGSGAAPNKIDEGRAKSRRMKLVRQQTDRKEETCFDVYRYLLVS